MAEVQVAHTAALEDDTLAAARDLLFAVFDDMTEDDWDHALGGLHVLVWEDGDLVAHSSLVQRRLLHGGRSWRTGYVEGVGVRADRRRRGHGSAMLAELERLAARAYDVAALGATDEAARFYSRRGWQLWRGTTSVLAPSGVLPTPEDDGGIYVLPLGAALDLDGELTCDWRDGDAW